MLRNETDKEHLHLQLVGFGNGAPDTHRHDLAGLPVFPLRAWEGDEYPARPLPLQVSP